MSMVNLKKLDRSEYIWSLRNEKGKMNPALTANLRKYGFFDVATDDERLTILLDLLERYKLSTAKKYFNQVKFSGFLGNTEIKHLHLSESYFHNRKNIKAVQDRVATPKEYETLVRFMYDLFRKNASNYYNENSFTKFSTNQTSDSKFRQAVLAFIIAVNTGLRRSEVLALTNVHLRQLLNREPILVLKMKMSDEWHVYYHQKLVKILTDMKVLYEDYLKLEMPVLLFDIKNSYFRDILRGSFLWANGMQYPPKGFGLHAVRYYIASFVADGKNLKSAQLILGHKSYRTTKLYVKYHHLKAQRQVERLEKESDLFDAAIEAFG
jgi:integrase